LICDTSASAFYGIGEIGFRLSELQRGEQASGRAEGRGPIEAKKVDAELQAERCVRKEAMRRPRCIAAVGDSLGVSVGSSRPSMARRSPSGSVPSTNLAGAHGAGHEPPRLGEMEPAFSPPRSGTGTIAETIYSGILMEWQDVVQLWPAQGGQAESLLSRCGWERSL
jgi:hypothetical protein